MADGKDIKSREELLDKDVKGKLKRSKQDPLLPDSPPNVKEGDSHVSTLESILKSSMQSMILRKVLKLILTYFRLKLLPSDKTFMI